MRQFTAGANDCGVRLSRFVLGLTRRLPNAMLYRALRTGRIKVNGKKAEAGYRLCVSDVVTLYLNDEFFQNADGITALPQKAPLYQTVYQDGAIAILYKPAGVFSHRSEDGRPGLLEAFTADLTAAGEYDPAGENLFSPALANRLDRGTEGLVMAAKTAAALRGAAAVLRQGHMEKTYLCVCCGTAPPGLHRAFLTRDRSLKTVKISSKETDGAKLCLTEVEVLCEKDGLSLCKVLLHTGRTHQIRAHLAFLGAPLAGDAKYGFAALNRRLGLKSQLLCADKITFSAAIPKDSALRYLAGKSFIAGEAAQLPRWWAEYVKQHR